ncbi:hypothetical protein NDA01_22075 [Trichocoleus desertorum AS-A10]|uniref:hypothetical protein n=1 Tax=Trichocoleus desertorum TaxID=1481672 RepID=UPI0032976B3B
MGCQSNTARRLQRNCSIYKDKAIALWFNHRRSLSGLITGDRIFVGLDIYDI